MRRALGLALAGWLAGCGGDVSTDVSSGQQIAALPPATSVVTARVQSGEIGARLTAAGTIHAHRTTPVGPVVPGRIIQVYVEAGQRVEVGSPLFQIDPAPYHIEVESARAGMALARAELNRARQQAGRTARLAEQNMVSAQESLRHRTEKSVASARVAQARARLRRAERDLERTLVRAPYAGSIVERRQHEGAMANVAGGAAVVVLQESDVLIANVDIPEASLAAVHPGDPARLFVEGVSEPILGVVAAVSDRIDTASRTYGVRIPVLDPQQRVKAGSFVRAQIDTRPKPDAVLVQSDAIARREGRVYLFRVRDDVVEQVQVRLGLRDEERVEVIDGVEPGDEVVVGSDVDRLQDGDRVTTQEADRA